MRYRSENSALQLCSRALFVGVLTLGFVLGSITPVSAQSAGFTPPDADALAQRFRPYYKFSTETDAPQELHRPCSWEWYFSHSQLTVGGNIGLCTAFFPAVQIPFCQLATGGSLALGPAALQANPGQVLDFSDVRSLALPMDPEDTRRMAEATLLTPVDEAFYEGEPWDAVIHAGAGLYAHVTQINDRLVNIEYWTLYAFNRVTGLLQSEGNHLGDLTGIHVVYDRVLDRLVRVTYGEHGEAIEAFDLLKAEVEPSALDGKDPAGNVVTVYADKYLVYDFGQSQQGPGGKHDDSDKIVYLVLDPQTQRVEHPAVFIEWGGHEPWPNETGFWIGAPKHKGDGVSFLPDRVRLLGPADDPFLYFGGKFGDPSGLQRHRFWLSEGIFIDDSFRNDKDPYTQLRSLTWPPTVNDGTYWTPPFSEEEGGKGSCPGSIRAIGCAGEGCDFLSLECRVQPPVKTIPGSGYWSDFFSDENGDDGQVCSGGRYVQGIHCTDDYCDNLSLFCASPGALTNECRWTDFTTETEPPMECGVSEVVAGARCHDDHCGYLSLYCCQTVRDTDGDGLWDDWERSGIDADGNGTIDVNLPGMGADPFRKDVFLEIDWMDCTVVGSDCAAGDNHNHRPDPGALEGVRQAFANAGISLHIDVSNSFAHRNFLAMPNCRADVPADPGFNFDTVKADPANFGLANPRRLAYHYALFTHQQAPGETGTGCGEQPGNDLQVSLGAFAGTPVQQAGTLMHELGHNLNLGHGGNDEVPFKPNYLSVMNYLFQFGIPPTDPDGAGPLTARVDYSRQTLPALSETSLSEPAGIGDGPDHSFFVCPNRATGTGVGNAAFDWNCDGDRTDPAVSSDVNGDGGWGILTGFQDWANLVYSFQNTLAFADGIRAPLPQPELDLEAYQARVAPDLSVAKTAVPARPLTGWNVTYTLTVANTRPATATGVRISDVLPPTMTLVSCAATGGGTCGGTGRNVEVNFPVLPGGSAAEIALIANLECSVADRTVVRNTATAVFSEPDPDPSNNSATAEVIADNPPPVISNVATDKATLSPPNHKMVDVTVSYEVTDNCGVPVCRLAVTSNEPVDAPGSGNTSPDWEILDAHRVRLRAERSGNGSGRIYTIGVTCTDSAGGATTTTTAVTVPH